MKKTLMILGVAALTFACNEATETEETTQNENTKQEESSDIEDEAKSEQDLEMESESDIEKEVEQIALDDRAYSVTEFNELYDESKEGLVGQTVTIEGFYMNHNKQRDANATDQNYQYNVTLYKDESFNRDEVQVFFMMKSTDENQFDGVKQKDQIKVTGEITDRDFFGAPLLEDGELVK